MRDITGEKDYLEIPIILSVILIMKPLYVIYTDL